MLMNTLRVWLRKSAHPSNLLCRGSWLLTTVNGSLELDWAWLCGQTETPRLKGIFELSPAETRICTLIAVESSCQVRKFELPEGRDHTEESQGASSKSPNELLDIWMRLPGFFPRKLVKWPQNYWDQPNSETKMSPAYCQSTEWGR